jgi:hypothetical protein
MRFGIELPLLNVGNPKWPARLTGGPMIQTVVEDKYSFNMQVSAEAMAAPDRDHSLENTFGTTTFDEWVQSIRHRSARATLRKAATDVAHA